MKKNVKTAIYTRNGQQESFNFYTNLKMSDKIEFVSDVVSVLISENYYSVLRSVIFDFMLIDTFTDIDTHSIMTSNSAVDDMEDFLVETDVVDIIKINVDAGLIDELNKAVDDAIEYKTGIHKNYIEESISRLLDTVEKKVSEFDTDSMMQMAKTFSGISGELTADKVLEAYTKSDIFQKNHENIVSDMKKHNAEIENTATAIKNATNKNKKNEKKIIPMK